MIFVSFLQLKMIAGRVTQKLQAACDEWPASRQMSDITKAPANALGGWIQSVVSRFFKKITNRKIYLKFQIFQH